MARPGITSEQVAAAADSIVAEGKNPTMTAVRERIGTGSLNTVQRLLAEWRQSQPTKQNQNLTQLPEIVTNTINGEIVRRIAEAKAEIEQRLVQSQDECRELAELGEVLESENSLLVEQNAALAKERDILSGKAEQQEREILELRTKLSAIEAQAETARIELAKESLRSESYVKREKADALEIERLRQEVTTLQKEKINAEQQAAILNEKLSSSTELRKAEIESLKKELDKSEKGSREIIESLRSQIEKSENRANDALEQVRQMQALLDTSRKAESEAKERLAILRGQVEVEQLKQQQQKVLDETNAHAMPSRQE